MKKIIIILIICITYSCNEKTAPKTVETIEVSEPNKQSDIDAVKKLISNSFNDIWAGLDSTKILEYHTKDFMLLENGVVWNNDSVDNYILKMKANKPTYKRLNNFDFLKTAHHKNTIWISYHNYAHFVQENDTLGRAHWLESAIAIKENNAWKLQLLHSTIVRE